MLSVNDILKWCQVFTGGRHYTCITKEIDGELCFYFKKAWHPVAEFISDRAKVLVGEGGKVMSVPYGK